MDTDRTWATVDTSALLHNLNTVRAKLSPGAEIAAVVKADAYGHGLVETARVLAPHSRYLAVATVAEAERLRSAGVHSPILILSPLLPPEAPEAARLLVTATVENAECARALANAAVETGRTLRFHLKIDTGMSRFGAQPEEAPSIARQIARLPGLELEGLCSHFACAEDNHEKTRAQLALFEAVTREIEQWTGPIRLKHVANSAATAALPRTHLDMVRVGSLLYGIYACDLALRPALAWQARIISLRSLPAGRSISYGATFMTNRPSRIATLPVGYADGYLRTLSNRGIVSIGGKEAPVVGRVCMDQLMVDVTDIPTAQPGDVVELIGGPVTVPRLADLAGTTYHEITTLIGDRVKRVYTAG